MHMIKNKLLILILAIFSFSCTGDIEDIELGGYLKSHQLKMTDYKIICIVPVDGYGKYINPSLNSAKNQRGDFLLVMASGFKKSIEHTIERLQIQDTGYVCDYNNIARKKGLVGSLAPCYYFLRYGKIVKKVDLSEAGNRKEIAWEVEQFFRIEDAHIEEMDRINKLQKQKKLQQ
jgi:hypothetical protein